MSFPDRSSLWPLLPALAGLFLSCAVAPRPDPAAAIRADASRIPPEWKEEPIIVLRDSLRVDLVALKASNEAESREVTWYYVNRVHPARLERILAVDFENIERPAVLNVTVHYPDGKKWFPGPGAIVRSRDQEAGYAESNRFHTEAALPRYVQGMLIRVEEVHRYERPEFMKSEWVRSAWPCLSKIIRVGIPTGSAIDLGLSNPEGLPLDTGRESGPERTTFAVSGSRLAKLDTRTLPREPEAWFAAVRFGFPPEGGRSWTWARLGDAYLKSIEASLRSTPGIERFAAGLGGPRDSLPFAALAALRARVRYHADIDKLHAFVPRAAGEVLDKGYGDCKEMSSLLAVTLRLKGIPAGLALVSPPGTMQPVAGHPTLGEFTHMVAYVPGPDGAPRFLDPTVRYGAPADSYLPILGRSALVLRPGGSALERVGGREARNRLETQASISQGGGRDWILEGTLRLDGVGAMNLHPYLSGLKGEEHAAFLRKYLEEAFGLSATRCKAVLDPDRTPIALEYQAAFTGNYLALDKGGLLINQPSLYGGEARYTTLDLEGPRHFAAVTQTDTWRLPEGFPELKADSLAHSLCRGGWSRKGTTLVRRYECAEADLPPSDRAVAQDFSKRKHRFARATVWR